MKRVIIPWAALRSGLVFADAGAALDRLRDRRQELQDASDALVSAADEGEGRDLTDEELEEINKNNTEVAKLSAQIKAREGLKPAGGGRKTPAEPAQEDESRQRPAAGAASRQLSFRPQDAGKHGFQSFGSFARDVRLSSTGDAQATARLRNAATTYGNESVGAEGGFLVPPDFAKELWTKVMEEENLLARASQLQTSSNSLVIPKDETTPWQTSGGIQVYWENEGGIKPPSKPLFEQTTLRLVKLVALVPITDELLEDAVGLESWLRAKAPTKMAAKINTAIISGTGVGQPLGILTAASLITVAKEGSQTADTINYANIMKMWSRMYAPWRRNSIWIVNQDAEPQFNAMAFVAGAASPVPAYMPAGGLSAAPYSTLMGRPVVPVEAASALGDVGDILLVDMKQYWALTKGGIKTDVSIHLYFDQDITTFRFVFRLNGTPAWSAPITPQNGSNTRGWAVALEAR